MYIYRIGKKNNIFIIFEYRFKRMIANLCKMHTNCKELLQCTNKEETRINSLIKTDPESNKLTLILHLWNTFVHCRAVIHFHNRHLNRGRRSGIVDTDACDSTEVNVY
jgi:hypothetical protein